MNVEGHLGEFDGSLTFPFAAFHVLDDTGCLIVRAHIISPPCRKSGRSEGNALPERRGLEC
jgi:hypothetical protein